MTEFFIGVWVATLVFFAVEAFRQARAGWRAGKATVEEYEDTLNVCLERDGETYLFLIRDDAEHRAQAIIIAGWYASRDDVNFTRDDAEALGWLLEGLR